MIHKYQFKIPFIKFLALEGAQQSNLELPAKIEDQSLLTEDYFYKFFSIRFLTNDPSNINYL